jgi:hypothetical protein
MTLFKKELQEKNEKYSQACDELKEFTIELTVRDPS